MSDQEENAGKGFRVVDRRRFTSEGQIRPGAEREDPKPIAAEPPRAAAPAREPAAAAPREAPQGRRAPPQQQQRGGIDFLQFVASLATNALSALGALPEGYGPPMPQNPEIAREYIEIIAMLQQKTQGNLTAEEEQTITRLLSDLKMQFVEATTGGGPAPGLPGMPRGGAPGRR
jgi:hypothetical protein